MAFAPNLRSHPVPLSPRPLLPCNFHPSFQLRLPRTPPRSSSSLSASVSHLSPDLIGSDGSGSNGGNGNGGGGHGGDHHGNGSYGGHGDDPVAKASILGAFLRGWNERISADPQFPFKVLMEEVVGVGACVIGDMASRPNFGLNELDFVFSTIVVGSILNFSLMYMLAPTSAVASATACSLPSIFASCPPGYMFEQGSYSLIERLGTFVYKGALFATVGFAAGLLGTTISNVLIGMRTKMDPNFKMQNKAPPTILNAATWALHMGVSSNLRYQAINGLEFAMANILPPPAFKASVFLLRAGNNVLGGMSFVALARLTGSQKAEAEVSDVHKHVQMSSIKENECVLSNAPQLKESVNASALTVSVGSEPSTTETNNTLNEGDRAREEDAGHATSDQPEQGSSA